MVTAASKYQLAEILVIGDDDPPENVTYPPLQAMAATGKTSSSATTSAA